MKKVLVACFILVISTVYSNNTNAQQVKIGYFNEEEVLGLFPGIQKVDTLLQAYVNDSLKPDYDYAYSELLRLDSTYKRDSAKMNPGVRGVMQNDILKYRSKIINWQQYQNQMIQQKQNEYLRPYLEKVYDALKDIIAEQKYTHVFKSDVFLTAPPTDNLAYKVAVRLKLPIPRELEEQMKAAAAAQGGGTGTGGGTPTRTTTAPKKN